MKDVEELMNILKKVTHLPWRGPTALKGINNEHVVDLDVKMSDVVLNSQLNTVVEGHNFGHEDRSGVVVESSTLNNSTLRVSNDNSSSIRRMMN